VNFKFVTITSALVLSLALPLWAQTDNQEFRATWVVTWEHISSGSTAAENMARVDKILDNHQKANMNAVLFQVRQSGTAYYNSSFEPWGSYAGYSDPGYDPLAYVVQEAHKRGMEVHAWFNVFQTSSTIDGTPVAEHPEWVCRDASGNAMTDSRCISPGLEAVRDYTVNVAMEIVNNYDIDGLHLDYVRWNEYSSSKISKSYARQAEEENWLDGMITDEQIEDLKSNKGSRYLYDVDHPYSAGVPTGFSSWDDWRRWSVTELVHSLHDSIQTVKPWVRLSVAALGKYNWSSWQGYGSVYQDAALWFNEGYIDQLTPMSYHWTTADGFKTMLTTGGAESWGNWIQPGVTAGRLFSVGPGSYIYLPPYDPPNTYDCWDNHPSIINACRAVSWVDGFQFFRYGSWNSHLYWDEAGETFFNRITKVRGSGAIDNIPPDAPTVSITKIDSLNYQITVTPPTGESESQWYVLYRSTDTGTDPDIDDILNIKFSGTSAFSFTDSYDGTQDYNGIYYYAATAMDRYQNESAISNVVSGEALPSFAPTVVSTYPAEGDTIPVNSVLEIVFSKTMDISTFEAAFSIEPTATVSGITWSSDLTTVSVKFTDGMAFNTHYSVTLGATLTDVNNVTLDGNGDGTAGDAFTIQFYTMAVDLTGPQIESIYPEAASDNVDIDCPITIVFDEIVESSTINSNTISLTNNDRNLTVEPVLNTLNNRSVLTIRAYSQLISDVENSLTISNAVTDTVGNPMSEAVALNFHTANSYYIAKTMIDDFSESYDWQDPDYSGSTAGTVGSGCNFGYSTTCYIPGTTFTTADKKSAYITYQWDTTATTNIIREHINASTPTTIYFDTTYTIQCYLFGDESRNEFNFSLYEYTSSGSKTGDIIEVGPWVTIDWLGWKLIEWDLGDESVVGDFMSSNRNMDGAYYGLDGLLLRKTNDEASISGAIYVDELRVIQRTAGQAPNDNVAPVLDAISDTSVSSGAYVKLNPTYTDANADDIHEFICLSDTASVYFKINGHTSGSKVFVRTVAGFIGISKVTIIVKDYGIGELSDTVSFNLTVTGSGIVSDLVPQRLSLEQNYPNPFNPVTQIKFSLPQAGQVQMQVYNLLGEQVAELINEKVEAGIYSFTFDGANLPSGQYFYRLVTDNKVITRKMVLIK